ncbi:hypothetical protein [Streptomyces sp. NPDC003877]
MTDHVVPPHVLGTFEQQAAERQTHAAAVAARLRPTASTITDQQLDDLYAEVERMKLLVAASETDGHAVRMAAQYADKAIDNGQRAERAEAAIARVRAVADRWKRNGTSDLKRYADIVISQLDEPVPGTAATQATDDAVSDVIRKSLASFWTGAPAPREHCGRLSPETLLTSPPTECVLRPGHTGSHADEVGCRWWPITEEQQ